MDLDSDLFDDPEEYDEDDDFLDEDLEEDDEEDISPIYDHLFTRVLDTEEGGDA